MSCPVSHFHQMEGIGRKVGSLLEIVEQLRGVSIYFLISRLENTVTFAICVHGASTTFLATWSFGSSSLDGYTAAGDHSVALC